MLYYIVEHNSKVDIMCFSIPKANVSDQQMHNTTLFVYVWTGMCWPYKRNHEKHRESMQHKGLSCSGIAVAVRHL